LAVGLLKIPVSLQTAQFTGLPRATHVGSEHLNGKTKQLGQKACFPHASTEEY
jgi:hypothetical protein